MATVGIALSAALATSARREARRVAAERFEAAASVAAQHVERRFAAYMEVLSGLRALFSAGDVGHATFRRYAEALDLSRSFPGFRVLNYAPRVNDREVFEASMRDDPVLPPGLTVRVSPPGERADYDPIIYIAPLAGNEGILGKDLGASPPARAALDRARDTGTLQSSGSVIQNRGQDAGSGLAVRMPVYRAGLPTGTVGERRAAYLGSVGAGFRLHEMLVDLTRLPRQEHGAGPLRLRLFDGGLADAAAGEALPVRGPLLHDTGRGIGPGEDGADEQLASLRAFDFAGRRWLVEVSAPRAGFSSAQDRSQPLIILLGGGTISLLLGGVLCTLMSSRIRAVALAHEMTRSLRVSERRLEEAQALARMGSGVLDLASGRVELSREARRIYGLPPEGPPPMLDALMAMVPAGQRGAIREGIVGVGHHGAATELEYEIHLPDGRQRWVHVNLRLTEDRGAPVVQGTVRDETARKKAAMRLELAHGIARHLAGGDEVEGAMEYVLSHIARRLGWDAAACWLPDPAAEGGMSCLLAWSTAVDGELGDFTRGLGAWRGPATGGSVAAAWAAGSILWRAVGTGTGQVHPVDLLARQAGISTALTVPVSGHEPMAALEFYSRTSVVVDRDAMGFMQSVANQLVQYLQRKQAERALRHLATHDPLTGLVNRACLEDRLRQALARARRQQRRVAVLFIDLDRFKRINDSLGHSVGDQLLRQCAGRLATCVKEVDTVARFGGDEFVVILEDLAEPADVLGPITRLLAQCAEPFPINGHELSATASIGVSLFPDDGADAETLLMNADAAMYRAKEAGGQGSYHFHAEQLSKAGQQRLEMEIRLRHALANGELFLLYQPKLHLPSGRITGVEALMRWQHPELGLISPAEFIPLAEETGLIGGFGRWALEVACADACRWAEAGWPLQMSVNLSARQFDGRPLAREVSEVLAATGLPAALLELEITESAVMQDPRRAAMMLAEIRALGVSLAIDDFGTGYSSLSYLQKFPLSTLKIDRSFMKDLHAGQGMAELTAGIIGLAHRMGMKVVAEGVETLEQLRWLRAQQCDEIQGYWLSRPVPAEALTGLLAGELQERLQAAAGG